MPEIENGVIVSLDRIEDMMRTMQEVTQTAVLVGIPAGSDARQGQIGNATLGYIHEFGSPAKNIPARPWLIPPVNRMQEDASRALQEAATLRFDGKPAEADQRLNSLGLYAVNKIKQNIVSGGDPPFAPNAPSTIARKGSDSPLIDSAQLLNSVNYVLRKRGGDGSAV